MKKTIISSILAAALMTTVALPAFAASDHDGKRGMRDGRHGPSIERLMENFDINKDGSITPDEVLQHRADIFASADTDSDGELTKDELKKFGDLRKEMRKQAREEIDNNGGGGENRGKERHAMGDERGSRGDHDGKRQHEGKRGDHHGKKGRHGGHGPDFSRLDKDGNGSVSVEEFTSNSDRMFKHLDRNEDGAINKDDFGRKRAATDQAPATPDAPVTKVN